MKTEELNFSKIAPIWVAVANVVLEREWGQDHEIRSGIKQFRGGAKVYLKRRFGTGDEVEVVGIQRAGRLITLIMPTEHLANGRAELLYKPKVIARLADYERFPLSFDGSDGAKIEAEKLVELIGNRQQPFATRDSDSISPD